MSDRAAGITLFASIGFLALMSAIGILHRWDAILGALGLA